MVALSVAQGVVGVPGQCCTTSSRATTFPHAIAHIQNRMCKRDVPWNIVGLVCTINIPECHPANSDARLVAEHDRENVPTDQQSLQCALMRVFVVPLALCWLDTCPIRISDRMTAPVSHEPLLTGHGIVKTVVACNHSVEAIRARTSSHVGFSANTGITFNKIFNIEQRKQTFRQLCQDFRSVQAVTGRAEFPVLKMP